MYLITLFLRVNLLIMAEIKIIKDKPKPQKIEIPNIGISRPKNDIGEIGVGFVIIPSDVERADYILDCYKTNTVTIQGGWGYGCFNNVDVDPEVMKRIEFPDVPEEKGTAVVWVKDDVSQLPIIIATIRKQEDYYALDENQYLVKREPRNTSKSVEVFMDGNSSTLQVNIVGDSDTPANLNIKVTSENESSVVNLYCDNEVNISAHNTVNVNSRGAVNINTAESITAKIVNDDDEEKMSLSYTPDNGLAYADEYKNSIICKEGQIEVISNDKNGDVIVRGAHINHNDGGEPMVLGDTLKNILGELIDAITALTVVTPAGPSSTPSNAVQFTTVKQKLSNFLSQKSNLD